MADLLAGRCGLLSGWWMCGNVKSSLGEKAKSTSHRLLGILIFIRTRFGA